MPTEVYPQKCSRCNKHFEAPFPPNKNLPAYCKDCMKLFQTIGQLERQLIAENFSIEQGDEKIARQINDILTKESSGVSKRNEQILTALTEKMLKDEKKRKRILKQILRLQKEKR